MRAFSAHAAQSTSNLDLSNLTCLASLITPKSQIRSIMLAMTRAEESREVLTSRMAVSSHLSNTTFPDGTGWSLVILNMLFRTFFSLRRMASDARRMDSSDGTVGCWM